jgi:hypothetical protein
MNLELFSNTVVLACFRTGSFALKRPPAAMASGRLRISAAERLLGSQRTFVSALKPIPIFFSRRRGRLLSSTIRRAEYAITLLARYDHEFETIRYLPLGASAYSGLNEARPKPPESIVRSLQS